jgi:hypothetical protein
MNLQILVASTQVAYQPQRRQFKPFWLSRWQAIAASQVAINASNSPCSSVLLFLSFAAFKNSQSGSNKLFAVRLSYIFKSAISNDRQIFKKITGEFRMMVSYTNDT